MNLKERVLSGLECCINEQKSVPECERCPYAEIGGTCTSLHKLHADAAELIKGSELVINGVWEYYTNDEGKARWRCSKCGKVVPKEPPRQGAVFQVRSCDEIGGVGMPKQDMRERVIKGLEAHMDGTGCMSNCPYWSVESLNCTMLLANDAFALLKAQEAVEPVVDIDTWKCGDCGHTLEHQELLGDNVLFHEQYNYCPECGRAVKR